MSQPTTFEEAKTLADQTYIATLQEQQSGLSETDPEYTKLQSLIEKGPLDFSSLDTHKMLIEPPKGKGGKTYTKKQKWISEDDPLRVAVEAQADVMQNYLDEQDISLVQGFGDKNPENIYGEGAYLNTGTAAHIDWDAPLKRMQRYVTAGDGGLGTYSQVFYRPEASKFVDAVVAPIVNLAAPQLAPLLTAARGGDLGDIVKSYAVGELTGAVGGDFLEDTLANLGVDADLFGMSSEAFTEGLGNVQETLLEGGSGKDALLKEFGGEALGALGVDLPEFKLPETGVIGDIREFGRTIDDTLLQPFKEGVETFTAPIEDLSTPLKEAVETVGETVVDAVDAIIDAVDSPLGDLLESAVGGATGGMMAGVRQPSQVEQIFDKDLFKFDTEIKSTQEMLSPMMNLRRYG